MQGLREPNGTTNYHVHRSREGGKNQTSYTVQAVSTSQMSACQHQTAIVFWTCIAANVWGVCVMLCVLRSVRVCFDLVFMFHTHGDN